MQPNLQKSWRSMVLNLEPTKEDKDIAAKLTVAYADNPETTSKKVTAKKAAALTPASLVLTNNILKGVWAVCCRECHSYTSFSY